MSLIFITNYSSQGAVPVYYSDRLTSKGYSWILPWGIPQEFDSRTNTIQMEIPSSVQLNNISGMKIDGNTFNNTTIYRLSSGIYFLVNPVQRIGGKMHSTNIHLFRKELYRYR